MQYDSIDRLKYRRTRIIATLGPASSEADKIRALIDAGVNVFRFNLSHGDHDYHSATYRKVREQAELADRPVAALFDLCGPKIRVGRFADGGIDLVDGQSVVVTTREVTGEPGLIPSQYRGLSDDVRPGQRVLLADGVMALQVEEMRGQDVHCRVINGGRLTDRKGINLPDAEVSAPCLTEKDKKDAELALRLGADYIALSFVRRASDVEELRELILDSPNPDARIVAKIERPEAVRDIERILEVTDSIMVARGDLGVELPPEQVPVTQNHLLDAARRYRKPSIVATQMLESMIQNPTPTRAEVTDVSNSVFSGADAVMLSAETAAGKHPLGAVTMMDRIARQSEHYLWQENRFGRFHLDLPGEDGLDFGVALSHATAQLSRELKARAIFVVTRRGVSPSAVSYGRPAAPMVVLSTEDRALRQCNLLWGALPIKVRAEQLEEPVDIIRELAARLELGDEGNTVLLVRGFSLDEKKNMPGVTLITI